MYALQRSEKEKAVNDMVDCRFPFYVEYLCYQFRNMPGNVAGSVL